MADVACCKSSFSEFRLSGGVNGHREKRHLAAQSWHTCCVHDDTARAENRRLIQSVKKRLNQSNRQELKCFVEHAMTTAALTRCENRKGMPGNSPGSLEYDSIYNERQKKASENTATQPHAYAQTQTRKQLVLLNGIRSRH